MSGYSYLTGQTAGGAVVPPKTTTTSPNPASGGTYYAPPPGAVQAGEDYSNANLAYQRALARFNQQRTGLLQQYGYKGTVDPNTGLMTNIGVDAGNTYGSLQQLLHNQANEDTQAEYAAQDRGLVGGLAHQGEQELAYGHHGQSSALANSLFGSLSDINSQQLDAKDTLDQALWTLQHQATTDATDSGDFNPADPGGGDGGGGSGAPASSGQTAAQKAAVQKVLALAAKVKPTIAQSQVGKAMTIAGRGTNLAGTKTVAKPAPKPAPKPKGGRI